MNPIKAVTTCILCCGLALFSSYEAAAQVEFELKPSQSMSITGKGPGQDAAVNPYQGQDCLVLIENIGTVAFVARTQQKGQKNLSMINLAPGTSQSISLPKGYELYLDTTDQGLAKAKLEFKPQED
jgi:hypothetical protein